MSKFLPHFSAELLIVPLYVLSKLSGVCAKDIHPSPSSPVKFNAFGPKADTIIGGCGLATGDIFKNAF